VLAELTEERFFAAGQVVQPAGARLREIHYLIEGEVEVRAAGRPATRVGPLGVINGLAAFAGIPRSDEVVAVTDTITLSLTCEDQEDLLEEHFEILARVLRAVAATFLDARRETGADRGAATPTASPVSTPPLGLVAKMAALRAATPFDHSPLEALADLARESPEVRYPAGQRLWSVGDEGGWSLVIVSGHLAGTTEGGREQLGFGPCGTPGALDTMAARPRWFDAVTETAVVALRIDGGGLLDLLEDHADMAFGLLRSLSRGLLAVRRGR
jgi:CRP-like cAMP-binding protein